MGQLMKIRWLGTALIACCSASCALNSTSRANAEEAEILYIPLSLATFTAVTVDNIDTEGSCELRAASKDFLWLSHLEVRAGHEFDEHNVRAKIRLGVTDFYVDSNGAVLTSNGFIGLSTSEKSKLVTSLEALRKASSCDQYDWIDD